MRYHIEFLKLALLMRTKAALPLCLVIFLSISCHFQNEVEPIKQPPSDWFYMQRAFPYNQLDYKAYQAAVKSVQLDLKVRSSQEGYNDPWQIVGPTNINGRITDIEMPVDDINTIYAATASGGIFKSTNQGDRWRPIFDDALSLSIGDMALAPSNNDIIYVGTGEANAGGGSLAYDGVGVYRSLDTGGSWSHLGLENVGSIGRIVINPQNPDEVYVAAMGRLFGNNADRGIYKTVDGGQSWEQVLFISDKTGGIDLAINPENPEIVYAAMWQRERRPHNRIYGGEESGIYRSVNGGDSWEELTQGLPQNAEDKGRIGIAIAPSNIDVLYTMYAKQDGSLHGLYKTMDGGDSWEEIDKRAISNVPFIWWFGKVFVHPFDDQIAYVTSLDMFQTETGGSRWFPIFEGAHVDHHALYVHPQNPSLVVNGNDGGVYLSQDGGRTYEFKNSIPNLQFYTCTIDNTDPEKIFGGTQDNGTLVVNANTNLWDKLVGGDGFRVLSDPDNPNIIFAEFQFGNIRRSDDGGRSFSSIKRGTSGPTNWNTPFILDPHDSEIIYYGSDKVFRSDDRGNSWTAITDVVPKTSLSGNLTFGTITSLAVSSLNGNYLYIGTDDGQVVLLNQETGLLTEINEDLPERWVTSIATDPFDENTVYVTLSGFRFDESGAHVFKSDNLGESWIDISMSLPDIPVNDIIVDPEQRGLLYIATDVGVYYSEDDGSSWQLLGTDLPLVPITDIDFHLSSRKLAAASYGRSIYTYNLPLPTPTIDQDQDDNVTIYPNPTSDFLSIEGLGSEIAVTILDVSGKKLLARSVGSNEKIDVSVLVSGTYLVKVGEKLHRFVKL